MSKSSCFSRADERDEDVLPPAWLKPKSEKIYNELDDDYDLFFNSLFNGDEKNFYSDMVVDIKKVSEKIIRDFETENTLLLEYSYQKLCNLIQLLL